MDSILTDKRRFCEHQFTEESYGYECTKCDHIQLECPWPEDDDDFAEAYDEEDDEEFDENEGDI